MQEAFITNPYHSCKQKCFRLIRIAHKGFCIVCFYDFYIIYPSNSDIFNSVIALTRPCISFDSFNRSFFK